MSSPVPDRDAIRARVARATPGPWSQGMIGGRLINEVDNMAAFGFVTITANYSDDGAGGVADADFIAHSIEDVPALLAALEATEAERDEAERDRAAAVNAMFVAQADAYDMSRGGIAARAADAMEKAYLVAAARAETAEARTVQLEAALRGYAPPLRVDAWHAEECWINDEDWFYERWLETADDCSPDTPYDERRAVFNAWWAIQPEPTDAEMCAEGCPYPRMRALLCQADRTGDTT